LSYPDGSGDPSYIKRLVNLFLPLASRQKPEITMLHETRRNLTDAQLETIAADLNAYRERRESEIGRHQCDSASG